MGQIKTKIKLKCSVYVCIILCDSVGVMYCTGATPTYTESSQQTLTEQNERF